MPSAHMAAKEGFPRKIASGLLNGPAQMTNRFGTAVLAVLTRKLADVKDLRIGNGEFLAKAHAALHFSLCCACRWHTDEGIFAASVLTYPQQGFHAMNKVVDVKRFYNVIVRALGKPVVQLLIAFHSSEHDNRHHIQLGIAPKPPADLEA